MARLRLADRVHDHKGRIELHDAAGKGDVTVEQVMELYAQATADDPGIGAISWALAGASKRLKIPKLTHHSLRHFFATICIESGVDIPTVSRWLGHSDGGALAMRVYGHLRDEHSQAAAAKVRVLPATGA